MKYTYFTEVDGALKRECDFDEDDQSKFSHVNFALRFLDNCSGYTHEVQWKTKDGLTHILTRKEEGNGKGEQSTASDTSGGDRG